MSTTVTSLQRFRTCSSSARPSGGAMRRSVTTTSMPPASRRRSALSPALTNSAWCPASASASAVSSAFRTSSSTTSTRISAPPLGQPHQAGGPFAGLARDPELAPRRLGEALRQEQPQPRARGLGGEERVPETLEHVGRHAGTAVGDAHLVAGAALGGRDPELPAALHRFERVEHEVQVELLQG